MNVAQLELRRTWAICGIVLSLFVVFDDFVAANASWLRWLALVGVVFAWSSVRQTRAELRAEGSERIASIVSDEPWLKAWLAFWACTFFGGAIYVTRESIRLEELFGFRVIVIAFLILMGPIIVLSEAQRFKELGEG